MLPSAEIPKDELEVWSRFTENEQLPNLIQSLHKLKSEGIPLSYKSNDLLSCQSIDEQKEIFRSYKTLLTIPNMPTCVQVIKKDSEDEYALSNLVLGTEMKTVLILDSQGTAIIKKVVLPSTPVTILVHGFLESEYKLIVGCRDDKIYFVKNNEVFYHF